MAYASLAERYRSLAAPVVRAGHAYPAAFEPRVRLGIEELAERALPDAELLAAGRPHLDEVVRKVPGVHDGPVLALVDLEGAVLRARPSGYFAAVATGDALRAEWEREGVGPLRERAHELAGSDALRNGHGRAAAVGLAVAVTHGDRVLLGRRSPSLAADPGLWDVVPSGMLEPGEPMAGQIARELKEELEVSEADEPQILGLAFDLLRLRPELCFTLELGSGRVHPGKELTDLRWLDPTGDWPSELTPSGAATLALLEDAR